MKSIFLNILVLFGLLLNSCVNGGAQTSNTNLPATDFSNKIKELPDAPIIDVRTPEEYAKGHLVNAKNFNWNGTDFDKQISTLDKSKPVFVYCLSGGRSSSAAKKMRSEGFKEVYELNGGIMKWRAAGLPETISASSSGMSQQQYNDLIKSDKLVLVDFYADWCAPCKKMKPYLEEISKEMADKVVVRRINADDNQEITKSLGVDALPVLLLYKNNEIIWKNEGYISKEDVVKKLK